MPGQQTASGVPAQKRRNPARYVPLLLMILAFALSFGITRRHEMANISPCVINFACNDTLDRQRGDYRKVQYGFPLTYRATETYTRKPDNRTTYSTALREFQPFNPVFAAMNVLFWSALLYYAWHLLGKLRNRRKPEDQADET